MNTFSVIEHPKTMSGPRHGGAREQRHHSFVVNGFLAEQFTEGSKDAFDYSTGSYYTDGIARRIAWWEKLLGCKVTRGRADQQYYTYLKD